MLAEVIVRSKSVYLMNRLLNEPANRGEEYPCADVLASEKTGPPGRLTNLNIVDMATG